MGNVKEGSVGDGGDVGRNVLGLREGETFLDEGFEVSFAAAPYISEALGRRLFFLF